MSLFFQIIYWTFVISSISYGVYLLFIMMDNDDKKYKPRDYIFVIPLGMSLSVFCIAYENHIYSFILGVIYWMIYIFWIKGLWRSILLNTNDGYSIVHKGNKDYNKILYDLDRQCPTCGYKCKEVDEIRCGNRVHYLFKCKECNSIWTGHFIK